MKKRARLIAFYLPQFYPIPENDNWWEPGFTEWTNVARAKPLFNGHVQPKLPADLGYYDLRVSEIREKQARFACEHGIEGFCYWHYWFGGGKRILERVFKEVLESGKPDFPFCLAWANQSWTGHWHGRKKDVLVSQNYFGIEDYTDHFHEILPAFHDKRYITVDQKPLFLIYNPYDIPDPMEFTNYWKELASKNGLNGIYFLAIDNTHKNIETYGMNGSTWHEPSLHKHLPKKLYQIISRKLGYKQNPKRIAYSEYVRYSLNKNLASNQYPTIIPNWDNTPRSQHNGLVYENSTPELFSNLLQKAIGLVENREIDKKLIFIKSWNEWAEGNYLEPDTRYGKAYLKVIKELID